VAASSAKLRSKTSTLKLKLPLLSKSFSPKSTHTLATTTARARQSTLAILRRKRKMMTARRSMKLG
jgi:hypothetical protein